MKKLFFLFLLSGLAFAENIDCSEKAISKYKEEFYKLQEVEKYLIDIKAEGVTLQRVKLKQTLIGLIYGDCKSRKSKLKIKKIEKIYKNSGNC